MFALESGPWDVFIWIRQMFGTDHDPAGLPESWPDKGIAAIIQCPYCLSVWMGFILLLLYVAIGPIFILFLLPFSISALALGFRRLIDG
jgi:hypothetical protein